MISGNYIVRRDVPDMIVALLMIALDPTNPVDLQSSLDGSLDALCTCTDSAEDATDIVSLYHGILQGRFTEPLSIGAGCVCQDLCPGIDTVASESRDVV